ncbi:YidB family protein [Usitatibacter palustris]|uniref:DUF937 domain-containing protein n=1 Tax=Usitatibacter palustris TaxID=2732487 RepID=A0A6M4HCA3_9PROT|nr:YidB family protein [Usitatibacter palustris]QJR16144.1 hypothetical protein DSM104440_02973 [Usitatibacter palustris]
MGLLDQLFDGVLDMVNDPRNGGLEGLVRMFQDRGLGGLVDSWVSTGRNLPISAEQLQQVLGHDRLGSLAKGLGMSNDDFSSKLSQLLPGVVDTLTPGGKLPDASGLEQQLGSLRNRKG